MKTSIHKNEFNKSVNENQKRLFDFLLIQSKTKVIKCPGKSILRNESFLT
jgi:hypothetical protein